MSLVQGHRQKERSLFNQQNVQTMTQFINDNFPAIIIFITTIFFIMLFGLKIIETYSKIKSLRGDSHKLNKILDILLHLKSKKKE